MGGLSTEEWLETHDWDMPTCEHLGTGYTLCVWMAETGHWPKQKPTVHSMNHKGSARMQEIIDRSFPASRKDRPDWGSRDVDPGRTAQRFARPPICTAGSLRCRPAMSC
jgi:hypothetical protein